VLLVEDEPAILNLGKKMLETMGFRVLAAGDPDEAIQFAEQHAGNIDLLVSDVVMPRMNGRDLAVRLQSIYPKLKCIFISGHAWDVVTDQGVLEEGVHFLEKPFSINQLNLKVREVLGKKEVLPA
jgi:CheY-like chemotaxis protein